MKEYKGFKKGDYVKPNPKWSWSSSKRRIGRVILVYYNGVLVDWGEGPVSRCYWPEESLIKLECLPEELFEI